MTHQKRAALFGLIALAGCATSQPANTPTAQLDGDPTVHCLLPPRVQQLGNLTYASRRDLVYETASRCRIRGGEYTVYDRSTPESSEAFYLGPAEAGDPVAQYNLGLVYESLFSPPRYESAATWYEKAAQQNQQDAMKNLAYLYEQGLGVKRDPLRAVNLLREAGGITDELVFQSDLEAVATAAEAQIRQLTAELDDQNSETARLKSELADTSDQLEVRQRDLANSRSQLIALTDQISELERSQDVTLQQEIESLKSQLAGNERLVTDQELTIATLEADVTAFQAQLEASERKAELKEQQLTAQLSEAERRSDAVEQQAAQEIAQRDTEIARLTAEMEALSESMQTALSDRELLRNEFEAANLQLTSEQTAQVEKLLEEVAARDRTIAEQLTHIESPEDATTQALSQATATTDTQAQQINQLNTELTSLQEKLAAQELAYSELETEVLISRSQVAQGEETAAEVDRLLVELNRRGEVINAQKENIDALEAQIASASAAIDVLQAKSEQQISERDYLQARLATVEAELVNVQASLTTLESNLSSARSERESVVSDMAQLQAQLDTSSQSSEAALASLRAELVRKNADLRSKDEQIALLERDLAAKQEELAAAVGDRSQLLATRGLVRWPTAPDIADISIGKRYAVVIGNDDYEYLRDLSTAVKGAQTVDRLLRERYGFETTLLTNARRQEILDAFSELRPRLTEDDYVLIYYAGHGEQDRRDEYVSYWLGVNARSSETALSADGINSYEISHNVKAMPAKHVMIIADSCYAGAMVRPPRVSTPKLDLDRRQLEYFVRKRSRTVLTSGGNSPVLDESVGGEHSVFTKALIDVLEENPDIIYGEALHAMLVDLVRYNADQLDFTQEPRFSEIADAGHRNGQFVFKSFDAE